MGLDNKRFVPTELGQIVLDLIMEFFPEIINVEFTAKMERDLDHVEDTRQNGFKSLTASTPTSKTREKAEAEMKEVEIEPEYADEDCELCGSRMVYKM